MTPLPGFGPPAPLPALAVFDPAERIALQWTQTRAFTAEWRLVSNDRTFAVLRGAGTLWRPVILTLKSGSFELRHQMMKGAGIAVPGARAPLARVLAHVFGSAPVEVDGERLYSLRRLGFLARNWELRTLDDMRLVHFSLTRTFFRVGAEVTFEDAGRKIAHAPQLLALCWFAVLNARRHAHGA